MSLAARVLEANRIPTVIAGSALDIVEHCGVPRFAFTDFPLGNPCGKPFDTAMQLAVTRFALQLLHSAQDPNTTVQTPHQWSSDEGWREIYSRVDESNREQLAKLGQQRRQQRAQLPSRPATNTSRDS